ncbi:MAG TPA: flagellar basal body rod protein FlgB [Candidatus Acidoferrales bacterium]|nr:flagellar basal body rod protein FlgB [Candidatus Acidoferrales bacterium]HTX56537.1 flagellar basal body rod protein FlgB [Candidatus Acidoferrales bacterium]
MADDFSILPLGEATTLLGEAAKGARMEHLQIANNIANVNTPGFRTSSVDFKAALQESLGVPPDPDELAMATDSDRQFAIGDGSPPVPYDPQPVVDTTTQMRVDQSNVDIDQQMAELSENTGYQETVSQLLQEQYKFIREAATESAS